MDGASSTSSAPGSVSFKETFREVVVILNDTNQLMMHKCINCGYVLRNHAFSKMSHWRSCPARFLFKYVSESIDGVYARCMVCNIELYSPKLGDMLAHHKQCVNQSQLSIEAQNRIFEMNTTQPSNEIEYISECVVSQREIQGQQKVFQVISAPGFRITIVPTPKGYERCSECQICKKTMRRPSQMYFTHHRKQCPLPDEVLLSVSTQPFDMTISSSMDDSQGEFHINRICFICNTTTSESFVSLYDAVSIHSNTPIYNFVWKFLDDKPSVRDDSIDAANSDWSSLCARCLDRVNQYDLARVTAEKLEEELRTELTQTEAFYAQQQNTRQTDEDEEVVEVHYDLPQTEAFHAEQQNARQADEDGEVVEVLVDPARVNGEIEAINVDSPMQSEADASEQEICNDPIQCSIELSDDEEEGITIELSDDEN